MLTSSGALIKVLNIWQLIRKGKHFTLGKIRYQFFGIFEFSKSFFFVSQVFSWLTFEYLEEHWFSLWSYVQWNRCWSWRRFVLFIPVILIASWRHFEGNSKLYLLLLQMFRGPESLWRNSSEQNRCKIKTQPSNHRTDDHDLHKFCKIWVNCDIDSLKPFQRLQRFDLICCHFSEPSHKNDPIAGVFPVQQDRVHFLSIGNDGLATGTNTRQKNFEFWKSIKQRAFDYSNDERQNEIDSKWMCWWMETTSRIWLKPHD